MSTQVAQSNASTPNTVVSGRYQLTSPIGAGGMGSVYRARDLVLGRDVAIKVFRSEAVGTDDMVRQEREIRLLSMLNHSGLINVYDAGRQNFDGSIRRFIVMELVDGASLEQAMREGPMTPYDVAAYGAQIAEGLAHVHSRGIVHRDVKPANILISDTASGGFRRSAKLGDFGIAHFVEGHRMTSDGTILGTAAYLSPEQVSGAAVDVSSDIYSLGLVLLEALTGEPEFEGSIIEAAVARVNRDVHIPDTLSPEWRELLRAMTSRVPRERPTAHEIAVLLHGRPPAELTGRGRRAAKVRGPRVHRKASFEGVRRRSRRIALQWTLGIVTGVLALAASFLLGTLVA